MTGVKRGHRNQIGVKYSYAYALTADSASPERLASRKSGWAIPAMGRCLRPQQFCLEAS